MRMEMRPSALLPRIIRLVKLKATLTIEYAYCLAPDSWEANQLSFLELLAANNSTLYYSQQLYCGCVYGLCFEIQHSGGGVIHKISSLHAIPSACF